MTEDVRELLAKEASTMAQFQARTTEMLQTLTKLTDDHERRIRIIEKTISYGVGALGALKILYDTFKPLIHA